MGIKHRRAEIPESWETNEMSPVIMLAMPWESFWAWIKGEAFNIQRTFCAEETVQRVRGEHDGQGTLNKRLERKVVS